MLKPALPRLFLASFAVLICLTHIQPTAWAEEPPRLAVANEGPVSFASTGADSAAAVWKAFGKKYGFQVVFAPQYRDIDINAELETATVAEALDRLALVSGQFWAPLDASSIVVALDTPQSRRTYEPQVIRTFRLENMRLADAMTTLRSLYGLKHVVADESRQTLTVRDTAARVALTADLLERLDVPADEVAVKVQLVTLSPEAKERELDGRALEHHLAEGRAQALIRSDLNIVGHQSGKLELKERDPSSGDLLAIALKLDAKVHPTDGEVTLSLDSNLVKVDRETEAAQNRGELSSESKGTSSAWRVRSGEILVVELPGRLGPNGDLMALALTPTIRRVGARGAGQSQFIGTETTLLRPSSPKNGGSPKDGRSPKDVDGTKDSEAERQAENQLKERLRARLKERELKKSE